MQHIFQALGALSNTCVDLGAAEKFPVSQAWTAETLFYFRLNQVLFLSIVFQCVLKL